MKFAKELEDDLVPEWRAKYLNYKLGKHKIKALTRAVRNASGGTPGTPRFFKGPPFVRFVGDTIPPSVFLNRNPFAPSKLSTNTTGGTQGHRSAGPKDIPRITQPNGGHDRLVGRQRLRIGEHSPLRGADENDGHQAGTSRARYGSIIGTPPDHDKPAPVSQQTTASSGATAGPPSLKLPGPALSPDAEHVSRRNDHELSAVPENAYDAGRTIPPTKSKADATRHLSIFPGRVAHTENVNGPKAGRFMSIAGTGAYSPRLADARLEAYREVDFRQADFFNFLEGELDMVESFYKQKEDEAIERLKVLRDQLHIMRDRRIEDLMQAHRDKLAKPRTDADGNPLDPPSGSDDEGPKGKGGFFDRPWLKAIDKALDAVKTGRIGRKTKVMETMTTPDHADATENNNWNRDYVRRLTVTNIPYRAAKRKLKLAMQEYYRGLELLKSYALLNRTAFRKINKKYDKALNVRPTLRFVNDRVNKAWFVQSSVVDELIHDVEDLYSRYFEGGQHKVAASKLRIKAIRPSDYTASVLRDGLMFGAGLVFGVQGLVRGAQLLDDDDPTLATNTSFLMQLYAGYFLMLLLVLLFCAACRFWTTNKVNYVFVFEFDTRHHLDWRQLFELPCFFFFVMCFTMWLNFTRYGAHAMYIYYPVILIGVSAIVLFFPARIMYYRTRIWFLYAMWRLCFAGLYPVEFRDFFLGDMFCSEAYSMGNIEVFFCLYAHRWSDPALCNSSHSRLLGFFATLPGIWRSLQCIRRYIDTRNVFPHLVNCGKYSFTILYYMSLSLFRIHKTSELKALFIFCASVNAVYCSTWDLAMDWSLLDPTSKPHPLLRDTLAYKQVWLYYVAIVVDPILRFNWVFYAIYADDIQHSAVLSFVISFSEVLRRGLWMLFRVENEHCTNVGRFRASRDIPLPYDVQPPTPAGLQDHEPQRVRHSGDKRRPASDTSRTTTQTQAQAGTDVEAQHVGVEAQHVGVEAQHVGMEPLSTETSKTSGADISRQATAGTSGSRPSTLRWRSVRSPGPSPLVLGLQRVGTALHIAHAQDFQRKTRPEVGDVEDSDDGEDLEVQSGYSRKIEEENETAAADAGESVENGAQRTGPATP